MSYSLAVYKNNKNIIIILPMAEDENGLKLSLSKTYVLEDYDAVLLSQRTKEAFEYAISETPWKGPGEDALAKASGEKNRSRFIRQWLRIWAGMDKEKGEYWFLPGKRERGGYTGIECDESLYTLPISASDKEIGEMILKAFEASI